jgi:hypothetical protein
MRSPYRPTRLACERTCRVTMLYALCRGCPWKRITIIVCILCITICIVIA